MPKRLLALVIVVILGVAGFAGADPGPNGSNNHGLCTAYFNGSETGQSHKRNAPPFVALAREVGNSDGMDNDGDGQTDEGDEMAGPEGIWDWCMDPENNPKGIGGNPDDPNEEGDTSGNSAGHGGGKKS